MKIQADTIKKYDHRSHEWLLLNLQKHFNKYIRLRDQKDGIFVCISCNKPMPVSGKNPNAGHFYSSGHYPALRFNENNVHAQCIRCNRHLSGNLNHYRINLEKKIGKEALAELDYIASIKSSKGKFHRYDLIDRIERYKERNKSLTQSKIN